MADFRYKLPSFEKPLNALLEFIFYYRLVIVSFAIGLLIYLAKHFWNSSPALDQLKNCALVLTGGSICIGIFYSIINYEHTQLKYNYDIKSSRYTLTFNAASDWHRPTMVENLKITKKLYDENKHLIDDNRAVEFFQILEKDEPAKSALVSIFNYLECISLGVNHGILDDDFSKKYFYTVFQLYNNNYGFYISHRRILNNSPETSIHFTNLAQKWLNDK
jgi:Domain of unknown function (DUF4760)